MFVHVAVVSMQEVDAYRAREILDAAEISGLLTASIMHGSKQRKKERNSTRKYYSINMFSLCPVRKKEKNMNVMT